MTGDSPFGELRLDPLHLGVVNAEFAKFRKILENRCGERGLSVE
jgi:hypothetical protein